jgi:hypothetical protein
MSPFGGLEKRNNLKNYMKMCKYLAIFIKINVKSNKFVNGGLMVKWIEQETISISILF